MGEEAEVVKGHVIHTVDLTGILNQLLDREGSVVGLTTVSDI